MPRLTRSLPRCLATWAAGLFLATVGGVGLAEAPGQMLQQPDAAGAWVVRAAYLSREQVRALAEWADVPSLRLSASA